MSEEEIRKLTFKGHKDSVLCLAHDRTRSLLSSGSEDGTARLWDLRTSRTALCLVAEGEVTSVAFAPPTASEPLAGPFARDSIVYLSVDKFLYMYDLRRATGPILRQRQVVLEATDEINQVSLACRGDAWVAAADDSGTVQLTDGNRKRMLRHDSDNLVMSAVFRPKRRDEIVSGGTDCCVHLWDITKPRRPLSSCTIEQDDAGANQVCNPPMVHSLAWSPSGRLLAAGLGDGTCSILQIDNRNLLQVARLREGHDASVVTVLFPNWTSQSNHVLAQDRFMASAGTDGAIFTWDLGSSVAGDGAVDPNAILGESMVSLENTVDAMSLENNDSPRILFGIPHTEKPNWMVCSGNNDAVLPSTFFVADTTNDVTAYVIPMR